MATDIRQTKYGEKLPVVRKRLDEEFTPKPWPARFVQIGLAAWLIVSAFIWPHSSAGFNLAWISGLVFIVLSVGAGFFAPVRALLGLAAFWFLMATFFLTEPRSTLFNNFVVALLMLTFSFLPVREIVLFRRHARHREEHQHA